MLVRTQPGHKTLTPAGSMATFTAWYRSSEIATTAFLAASQEGPDPGTSPATLAVFTMRPSPCAASTGRKARDLFRGGLQRGLLDVGHDHVEPGAGEPLGQRQADAAGGPGDDGYLPRGQLHGPSPDQTWFLRYTGWHAPAPLELS